MNLLVSHWSANAVVLAGCLLVTAVHLAGLRGLRADARRGGPPLPPGLGGQVTAFYFGLLAIVLALVSPLGHYGLTFIWVRTLQALLLAVVAPPLIVLGAPWLALWRGIGRQGRPAPGPDEPAVADLVPPRWLSWPVAVTVLFNLVWIGWYLPPLYDTSLHHPLVLGVQAVSYLGAGVLFWLQLIGSRPFSPRFGPLHRVMLITATVVAGTILGMVLGFDPHVLYPAYRGVGGHTALTVPDDQQLGGAELWVLMLLPYVITGVALLVRWVHEDEAGAVSRGLERMLRPPKPTWAARSGWR